MHGWSWGRIESETSGVANGHTKSPAKSKEEQSSTHTSRRLAATQTRNQRPRCDRERERERGEKTGERRKEIR